jgi:DNA polymerase-3 subunit delta'
MDSFETFPEQPEAKRLLRSALAEGPAHAYLFHGPRGVGKRRAALAFAAELIGEPERVLRHAHPDVYPLEPLGDQIRIDDIRSLRHDLHMRPFEAQRRVYLLYDADTMNEDAADALLKDLEEPPPYAVMVLIANDLGPLPETIRSRCQHVAFRRLSERAVREELEARAPGMLPEQRTALARVAGGRLDRVARLLDPAATKRRDALLALARDVYRDPAFEPAEAANRLLAAAAERGDDARAGEEQELERLDLTQREADQRLRRAQRGAEREELLASLEELEAWYRDLVVVATGAERAAIHSDRLAELHEDASVDRLVAAERACELVRQVWRELEEFNLNAQLALEALFVRLRRELAPSLAYES